MSIRRPVSILLLLLFSLLPSAVFAGGQQEGDPLVQAAALIDAKQYNQAVSILTQVAKEDPRRFDEIQTQLQRIREAREGINEKYEELLETYETDLEQAYVLIKELEELDPDPNDRSRESIIRARETAGFVYNRNRWEGIMEAALAQLNQGLYWEAVLTYLGGFDLSRDIFDDAGYGDLVIERVDSRTSEVQQLLDRFARLEQLLHQHRTSEEEVFNASVGREAAAYTAVFQPLLGDITLLSEILLALDEAARFFLNYEESIRLSRGDEKEIHHLIYLALLISGRPDSEVDEGIAGAVERIWRETLTNLNDHTESLLAESFTAGQRRYDEENFAASRAAFREAEEYSVIHQRSLGAWAGRLRIGPTGILPERDRAVLALQLPREATARLQGTAAGEYQFLMDRREVFDTISQGRQEMTLTEEGRNLRASLLEERELLSAQLRFWETSLAALREREGAERVNAEELTLTSLMGGEIQDHLNASAVEELALVVAMETLEWAPLLESLALQTARYEETQGYLEGIPLQVGEGAEAQEILAPFPDRALEILVSLSPETDRLTAAMTAILQRLRGDAVRGEPEIEAVIAEGEAFLASLSALAEDTVRSRARAEEEIFQANRFRQEGDRRLQESQRLVNQGEFPGAKERLTIASARYDESLIHQEDPELRRLRDLDIPELFEEIRRAENRLVIQQVRQYLTQGQTLYSQNEFASANNLFLRAENRWADTNAEPNPEVLYWLELTRTALSVTTGREIASTDPLFAEMFQYLNQATEDYNLGSRLLARGEADEANIAFDNAEQSLLLVQQFFPFNKDARVLNIKIAQQRDPQGFVELFQKDFNDARSKIATNPQEAYVELKDLEALEPRYPGLQAAIEEAEYATGIKVRPPDPAKIRRSNELYQQALVIVNGNVRTEFPVALAFLDEALSLNPANREASRLKDTVAISVGGTTTSVLSSADQRKYTEAVAEFNNGNYLKAQILVDILLENPDNRYNTRLLELKERIQSAR